VVILRREDGEDLAVSHALLKLACVAPRLCERSLSRDCGIGMTARNVRHSPFGRELGSGDDACWNKP
jgi:hypothetical protein